jgi:ParB-like chromosome segregation protein Spo0J
MNKTKMVPLNKIKDNPWRDRVRNPIDADRVEAIAVSIGKTKYWMGTYGRELPDGTVQLAFGHHRVEGAKAQGLKEIPIIIEDFTDGEMLVWMAQENVRGEVPVVLEAVITFGTHLALWHLRLR